MDGFHCWLKHGNNCTRNVTWHDRPASGWAGWKNSHHWRVSLAEPPHRGCANNEWKPPWGVHVSVQLQTKSQFSLHVSWTSGARKPLRNVTQILIVWEKKSNWNNFFKNQVKSNFLVSKALPRSVCFYLSSRDRSCAGRWQQPVPPGPAIRPFICLPLL